jgi:hypothetical protein
VRLDPTVAQLVLVQNVNGGQKSQRWGGKAVASLGRETERAFGTQPDEYPVIANMQGERKSYAQAG